MHGARVGKSVHLQALALARPQGEGEVGIAVTGQAVLDGGGGGAEEGEHRAHPLAPPT